MTNHLDSIQPSQRRTGLFLAITIVLLLFRIIVLVFNKFDVQSMLVTRSFVGNGFLSKPLFSELLLSILIILLLFRKVQISKPLFADFTSGLMNAMWFLSFPVITAFCLFTFKQEYYCRFQFNEMLLLRWLYFILTFVAVNSIININPFHKLLRVVFVILILLVSSVLEDVTFHADGLSVVFGTISGVGLTQAFSIIAFRNTSKRSFWAGVFSVLITSSVVCFFVFAAVSDSTFTFLLPFVALLLAAITLRSYSVKPRVISLCTISLLSICLSLFLPSFFPPEYGNAFRENRTETIRYQETVSGIQINYNDTSVHKALAQVARILNAANQVSRDNFGVSPDIQWITVYGIEQGGFNAVYPQGIRGNFSSQQWINDILDSTFLNNPNLSCQFPDPVNAILHEYSHLYGIFPYQKWISTESEGWATYSATRLSKLLFQKYGAKLWQPAYNYARIADSISEALLSGHPLVWSHPEEVGAFKMWNDYEQKAGLQDVFKNRWQYTSRDKYAVFARENSPSVINDFINTIIGQESFDQVSDLPSRTFDELYKVDDWKSWGQLINKSDDEMERYIGQMKMREININVPEPKKNTASIESIVMIGLLLLYIFGTFKLRR